MKPPIERSKFDLTLRKPVLNAAGSLGFAPDPHAPVAWEEFGGFVTNPISMRPRSGAKHPILHEFPGGFLLHTGLPNPGFASAVKTYSRRWAEASLPVIVHLMADRPEETRRMVLALENLENIMAVELGFAALLAPDLALLAIELAMGELPVIVCLPAEQVLDLGPRAVQTGASAISLAAPRGTVAHEGSLIAGRLFGPSLHPRALEVVISAGKLGLPIIGSGGIFSRPDVEAMLQAGALAVEIDAQFWLPKG